MIPVPGSQPIPASPLTGVVLLLIVIVAGSLLLLGVYGVVWLLARRREQAYWPLGYDLVVNPLTGEAVCFDCHHAVVDTDHCIRHGDAA